ncbi:hypothetical protein KSP39_PZI014742 [Platanthera zijinensis]|uniref:Uncharacterized protein n=1 Tax=Platanthera zijinensis TaxID=2320716 RepID=A0AAP0G312_9ASPA
MRSSGGGLEYMDYSPWSGTGNDSTGTASNTSDLSDGECQVVSDHIVNKPTFDADSEKAIILYKKRHTTSLAATFSHIRPVPRRTVSCGPSALFPAAAATCCASVVPYRPLPPSAPVQPALNRFCRPSVRGDAAEHTLQHRSPALRTSTLPAPAIGAGTNNIGRHRLAPDTAVRCLSYAACAGTQNAFWVCSRSNSMLLVSMIPA